ncbi:MAG: pseudouridine synthase [Bacteroidia bacterium]|jgi:23S rRNA pseudouridine2605 synthase|nr:pseudouridine synthase [Bacteroidia bacterium]
MKKSFGRKPSSGGSGKSFAGGKKPYGKSSKSTGGERFSKSDKPFRKSASGFGSDDKPRRKFDDEKPKRSYGSNDDKPRRKFDDEKPKRSYGSNDDKPYGKSSYGSDKPKRSYGSDDEKPRRKFNDDKPYGKSSYGSDKPKRSYGSDDEKPRRKFNDDKPYGKSSYGSDKPKRSYGSDDEKPRRKFNDDKPYGKSSYGSDKPKRSYGSDDEKPRRKFNDDKPYGKSSYGSDKPKRSYGSDDEKPKRTYGSNDDKPRRKFDDEKPKRSYGSNDEKPRRKFDDEKPKRTYGSNDDKPRRKFDDEKPNKKSRGSDEAGNWEVFDDAPSASSYLKVAERPAFRKSKGAPSQYAEAASGTIRLNRFIANTGLCSRREADDLIEAGVVKVNGKIVTELGTKISPSDTVHYGDQLLRRERMQYVLLNKPKDFITTTDDPQERKTVLQLVSDACDERIYPVGRLDRNTTGLLLLTNDGDLAERLMHPRYGIRKIYHVTLDMALKAEHFEAIENGIELEDGPIKADEISYVGEGGNKKEVGIVLHSGRNRIVRRIFEHLGYQVVGLDRVVYAGLTKKNLPRSRWRHLTEEEVGMLKMTTGAGSKKVKAKTTGYRSKKKD